MDQFTRINDENEISSPSPLPDLNQLDIAGICCGGLHTAFWTFHGDVFTFGCNDSKALGRGTDDVEEFFPGKVLLPNIRVCFVTCGDNHTALLDSMGNVYLCGTYKDTDGSIGFPVFSDVKNECGDYECIEMQESFVHVKSIDTAVISLRSGENHTVALDESKGLWTWGSNQFGCLIHDNPVLNSDVKLSRNEKILDLYPKKLQKNEIGLDESTEIKEIFCGCCTTFITTSNPDRVFGCGKNSCGEVGSSSDKKILSLLEEIQDLREKSIKYMGSGQYFTVALDEQGIVYSWGRSEFTGLGIANEIIHQPMVLSYFQDRNLKISYLYCGGDHSLAISDMGLLFTWGAGSNYQLGNSSDSDYALLPYFVHPKSFGYLPVLYAAGGSQHSVGIVYVGITINEESEKSKLGINSLEHGIDKKRKSSAIENEEKDGDIFESPVVKVKKNDDGVTLVDEKVKSISLRFSPRLRDVNQKKLIVNDLKNSSVDVNKKNMTKIKSKLSPKVNVNIKKKKGLKEKKMEISEKPKININKTNSINKNIKSSNDKKLMSKSLENSKEIKVNYNNELLREKDSSIIKSSTNKSRRVKSKKIVDIETSIDDSSERGNDRSAKRSARKHISEIFSQKLKSSTKETKTKSRKKI